ncbi:MAG: DUF512 domain-containing protein [Chitinivibrionales bacterium]|nr:DUF512 domain-containing protein [Chitinivibrionales bacterium]
MTLSCRGIIVKNVAPDSPASRAGLRKNDRIVAVDGHMIENDMDFGFYSSTDQGDITFVRKGKQFTCSFFREPGVFLGLDCYPQPLKRCPNKCLFCFIDQLPSGLRKSLYVKDEDYIHSFIHGNYITCAGLRDRDVKKISRLGLSPLYISVHATDPAVRNRLLGNRKAPDIRTQLRIFEEEGVAFHTQIVVCPGINDGSVLTKTIADLMEFDESLLSIAVVPVGLTKYHKNNLTLFTPQKARRVCEGIKEISDYHRAHEGFRRIFCADEFFLLGGVPLPKRSYYEDYPQIENGIGLVNQLLEEWGRVKKTGLNSRGSHKKNGSPKRIALITSLLAAPFLQDIAGTIEQAIGSVLLDVVPVVNNFFGSSVTVAGLLSASDIIRAVKNMDSPVDYIIVPDIIFNTEGYTLDSYSLQRMERTAGVPFKSVDSVTELVEWITLSRYEKK